VAHQARAYPGFCSMKQLGVFQSTPLRNWLWNIVLNSNYEFKKLAVVIETKQNLSFHFVVLQRMVKKRTKNYKAHAQPLFCSLNLSFSNVPIAVPFVVFFKSLLTSPIPFYTPGQREALWEYNHYVFPKNTRQCPSQDLTCTSWSNVIEVH